MQVNSVSSKNIQSFGNRERQTQKQYLEAFASLEDKDIQKLAWANASEAVNDKKHRRIQNGMFYSIPLVTGLSAAVSDVPELIAKNSRRLRGTRLAVFGATSARWLASLAVIDLVLSGKHSLEKHNKTAREFANEHPIMSMLIGAGAAIGALALGRKGLSKLAAKNSEIPLKTLEKISKINKSLNNSKVLNKLSAGLAKVPSAIKSFAKGALSWGPMMLILSIFTKNINHNSAKAAAAQRSYTELKVAQGQVRTALEMNAMQEAEAQDVE